ncbi:hypothetical protein [Microbulbifer sp. PAAF003]|uniref:hypothetical protein n=1 Tax=Microbulbifer sp. PAAF003 TaxID=3243375 RepID=UPI004039043C
MKRIIFLLVFGALIGCQSNSSNSEERTSFWKEKISKEIAVGAKRKYIETWAEKQGFKLSYDERDNYLFAIVESLDGDGIVCSKWHVGAKFILDKSGQLESQEIEAHGTCL